MNYSGRQNAWLPPSYQSYRTVNGAKLPATVPGVALTTTVSKVTTTITISKDDTSYAVLPMPYAPYQLDVGDAAWRETAGTLMVFNPGMAMANLHYTVHSEEVNPQAAEILNAQPPGDIASQYGRYNGPDFKQLNTIALAHTHGAGSQLQEAQDLEKWFQSASFSYSLKPDLPETNWLLPFLNTVHRGFCVQFAQAFAILARVLGIPARIAIGYTGGSPGPGKTWQVTTADAHAWPELYFYGYGWLRFEPTPSGSHGADTAVQPVYAGGISGSPGSKGGGTQQRPTTGHGSQPGGSANHLRNLGRDVGLAGSGAASAPKRASSKLWLAIAIPAALFLLIAWPALTRLLTRRRRWLSASSDAAIADAAWRELTDDLEDYGLGGMPGETPRAVARRVTRLARLDETAAKAVSRLAAAEERARYARLPDPGAGLKAAVVTVRRAIAASVPRRQRLRARLLPASTLQAAMHLIQRASEMLGWLDSSWPTLQRQLHRTRRAE